MAGEGTAGAGAARKVAAGEAARRARGPHQCVDSTRRVRPGHPLRRQRQPPRVELYSRELGLQQAWEDGQVSGRFSAAPRARRCIHRAPAPRVQLCQKRKVWQSRVGQHDARHREAAHAGRLEATDGPVNAALAALEAAAVRVAPNMNSQDVAKLTFGDLDRI